MRRLRPPPPPATCRPSRRASPLTRHLWGPVLGTALLLAGCAPSTGDVLQEVRGRIERQDRDGARILLKDLLQQQPTLAEARWWMARVLLDSGDTAAAEVELRRALEQGWPAAEALPLLGRLMLQQDKAADLLRELDRHRVEDPAALRRVQLLRAEALLVTGRVSDAERLLAPLAQGPDAEPGARLLQARVLRAQRRDAEALQLARQLTEASDAPATAWLLLGDLQSETGAMEPAIASWRQALQRQPDAAAAHGALITALLARGERGPARAQYEQMRQRLPGRPQTLFFEATFAALDDQWPRTRELTQQLLRGSPPNARLLMLAGQAELQLGAPAQAQALLAKAVQSAPQLGAARALLAQALLRTQRPAEALETLAPLIGADSRDAAALTLAAQARRALGQRREADALIARASQIAPDNGLIQASRQLMRLEQGPDSGAEQALAAAAGRDEGLRLDLALLATQLQRKDVAGARQTLVRLQAKKPDSPLATYLDGRLTEREGRREAAMALYRQALTHDVDFMPAIVRLGELELAAGQGQQARERFEALLSRKPGDLQATLLLADTLTRLKQGEAALPLLETAIKAEPRSADARLAQADLLLALGRPEPALNAVQAGLVVLRDHPGLLERQGRAQLALGQPRAALATLGRLGSNASPQAQLMLAEAQRGAGRGEAARATLQRLVGQFPQDAAIGEAATRLALEQGRRDEALAQARRLQGALPRSPLGALLEADITAAANQWDASAKALRLAAERSGLNNTIAARLHRALSLAGREAEAKTLADDWLRQQPKDPGFRVHLGDMAMARQDPAAAEALYRQAQSLAPDSPLVLNNLAQALAQQKKPGATALARRAVSLAPEQPALLDTLAECLAAESRWSEAADTQSKAVRLAPEDPGLRLQLARWQLQAGDKTAAAQELQQLARLGSRFARQDEVSRLLQKVHQ
ncbi:MAG: hypothetical protein RLY78_954 [Pseudomonadota bacterium]